MKLIVGLGNPGAEYANTRHNAGFMVVDKLAEQFDASYKQTKKFEASLAEVVLADGQKAILAKPTTFMNLTGNSVSAIVHYHKINISDITVIFDDVDVEFGSVKVGLSNGNSTHNGLRSIYSVIGAGFNQVRVGIRDIPARGQMALDAYVLAPFSSVQAEKLPDIIAQATRITLQ